MVKRQTVWLSTMMVLSLMLIGYYTMNNPSSPAASSSSTGGTAVSTGVAENPPISSGGSASSSASQTSSSSASGSSQGTSAAPGSSTSASSSSTASSSNDFFVQEQTQVDSQMSKQLATLQQVISNTSASSATISQAEQQLQSLTNLQGNLLEAKDAVIGDGYQDCVIVPTGSAKLIVYVKATKFGATDAVNVLNIVSQQMNIPMTNIVVKQHS